MADTPNMLVVGVSVAIARGLAIARQFVLWAFADEPAQRELPKRSEPRRLSIAEQWTYLSDIVMGAASRAEEATRCHASATQQLDLAQYALTSLVDELSAVMDMGGRRRPATVHMLSVAPSPSLMPIGAAIAA